MKQLVHVIVSVVAKLLRSNDYSIVLSKLRLPCSFLVTMCAFSSQPHCECMVLLFVLVTPNFEMIVEVAHIARIAVL